jgi:hypothetical protein
VNGGESDVRGVAVSRGGQQFRMKNAVRECFSVGCQIQHRESGVEFESAFRHFAFSGGNFVEDDLRREEIVLLPPEVPPVAGGTKLMAVKKTRLNGGFC